MSNIYTQRQQWKLLIASIFVVGLFILYGLQEYISAFLGSLILYVVFRPLFNYLLHKKNFSRLLATVIILIFSLLVIVLPFLLLSIMLVNRVVYYSQNSEELMQFIQKAEDITGITLQDDQTVQTLMERGGTFVVQLFPSFVGGALDLVVIIGLMYFALFYMFMNQEQFVKGTYRYLPFDPSTLDELLQELQNMVNANVIGQGVISFIQGGLTGLALYVFGFQDALFWGTVSFFLSFIPVLGTPLVWGPAGIIAIARGDVGQGVGLLLVGTILIVNIDNVLRMMFAQRMGNVHPLVTITGIVLGVPLFGILGLVIGPLLIDYFIVLIKVFERHNGFKRFHDKNEIVTVGQISNEPPAPNHEIISP